MAYYIVMICLLAGIFTLMGAFLYYYLTIVNKKTNKNNDMNLYSELIKSNSKKLNLTFEEVNEVIDEVYEEITKKKYMLYYRLKELSIIPDMEGEAKIISNEILNAFDPGFIEQVHKYYSTEYFIRMITRRVQMFLVDYTNTYKPPVK